MVNSSLSPGVSQPFNEVFRAPISATRNPTSTDRNYGYGQLWVNRSTGSVYALSRFINGVPDWELLGASSGDVNELTGDTGGAITPTNGNINVVGSGGITVTGTLNNSTLTIDGGGVSTFPVTPFVVGLSTMVADYTSIQAAITAAETAGGGTVYIQDGTYTENLTFSDLVNIQGNSKEVIIVGTHTAPATGSIYLSNCTFQDAANIFMDASASAVNIYMFNCELTVTNGIIFDVANWTGFLSINNCTSSGSDVSLINASGGLTVSIVNSDLGFSTGTPSTFSGSSFNFKDSSLGCPLQIGTSGQLIAENSNFERGTVAFQNDSTGSIRGCSLAPINNVAAVDFSTSGNVEILNSSIDTSNTPAIDGNGAGNLELTNVAFIDDITISATITVVSGHNTYALTFRTTNQATQLAMSGSSLVASGSNTDVSINLNPKGDGAVRISSDIIMEGIATQLTMNGGAATDFIGSATLIAGTVTVANTNIKATDRIFLSRNDDGASSTLGVLGYTISAGASFTINSYVPTTASIDTADASSISYFIVNQT